MSTYYAPGTIQIVEDTKSRQNSEKQTKIPAFVELPIERGGNKELMSYMDYGKVVRVGKERSWEERGVLGRRGHPSQCSQTRELELES